MYTEQDKQKNALNSLHDVSDYASYIDQRIVKLNLLYESLSFDKKGYAKSQPHKNDFISPKLYETVKQPFSFSRRGAPNILQYMQNTEYLPKKRGRYDLRQQQAKGYSQLKSDNLQFDKTTLLRSTIRSNKKMSVKNNSERLKQYQDIKNSMLGTFYVGGRTLKHHKNFQKFPVQRNSQWNQNQYRIRRGKIWHGRPPVKIIQKY